MNPVRSEPVEGLCFDWLSMNGLANKPGRINSRVGKEIDASLNNGGGNVSVSLYGDPSIPALRSGTAL